jgi:osmotically-inducible protein OsmY
MQRIVLAVPFLLLCPIACRGSSAHTEIQGDAASLTSAVMPSPSDQEIVSSLQDAIEKSRVAEPQAGDVRASAVGGVVTLQGHVGTASAKERIDELARHTPGVMKVIDQLEAPEPNPSVANDTEMTEAIQHHLAARQDNEVRVTTEGAKVVLEGTVPTEVEKAEIQKLAEHTPNVVAVENRLRIRPLTQF